VKNLNFATTDEALKNFFADAVGKQYIRAAVIPKRERMVRQFTPKLVIVTKYHHTTGCKVIIWIWFC